MKPLLGNPKKLGDVPNFPPEHYLPVLPPLPNLKNIRSSLKKLIRQAYEDHGSELIRMLSRQDGKASR